MWSPSGACGGGEPILGGQECGRGGVWASAMEESLGVGESAGEPGEGARGRRGVRSRPGGGRGRGELGAGRAGAAGRMARLAADRDPPPSVSGRCRSPGPATRRCLGCRRDRLLGCRLPGPGLGPGPFPPLPPSPARSRAPSLAPSVGAEPRQEGAGGGRRRRGSGALWKRGPAPADSSLAAFLALFSAEAASEGGAPEPPGRGRLRLTGSRSIQCTAPAETGTLPRSALRRSRDPSPLDPSGSQMRRHRALVGIYSPSKPCVM